MIFFNIFRDLPLIFRGFTAQNYANPRYLLVNETSNMNKLYLILLIILLVVTYFTVQNIKDMADKQTKMEQYEPFRAR